MKSLINFLHFLPSQSLKIATHPRLPPPWSFPPHLARRPLSSRLPLLPPLLPQHGVFNALRTIPLVHNPERPPRQRPPALSCERTDHDSGLWRLSALPGAPSQSLGHICLYPALGRFGPAAAGARGKQCVGVTQCIEFVLGVLDV